MNFLTELIAYLTTHGPAIITLLLTFVAFAEAVVRLTPTEKDDGAVERIGKVVRKIIDALDKVFPNLKKGGGKHDTLQKKEEKEKKVVRE